MPLLVRKKFASADSICLCLERCHEGCHWPQCYISGKKLVASTITVCTDNHNMVFISIRAMGLHWCWCCSCTAPAGDPADKCLTMGTGTWQEPCRCGGTVPKNRGGCIRPMCMPCGQPRPSPSDTGCSRLGSRWRTEPSSSQICSGSGRGRALRITLLHGRLSKY